LLSLFLVPFLLFACGALWQTDVPGAIQQARTGKYKEAAATLESVVAGGNVDPQVVESLYFAWIRQGEYAKARERFDAWAARNASAAPIRLAAARLHHLTGNFDQALTHLNAIQNAPNVAVAAQFEKAKVLEDTGKRDEAKSIYDKLIAGFQNGTIRLPNDLVYVARAL